MFRKTPVQNILTRAGKLKFRIWHDPYSKTSDYGMDFPNQTAIVLDPLHLTVVIVGTAYAGEIKKAAFTLANYKLPEFGFLPMHASANTRPDGTETSVLFGLSGTGKTTLSADPNRALIGDDEIVAARILLQPHQRIGIDDMDARRVERIGVELRQQRKMREQLRHRRIEIDQRDFLY